MTTLTAEQAARRATARQECDQLRAELRHRGFSYGARIGAADPCRRELVEALAAAYEVVAETSTCPAYELGQARELRASLAT